MIAFLFNILLAVLWMFIGGFWSAGGFWSGFLVGAVLVSIVPPRDGRIRYAFRLWRIGKLALVFLKEFSLSTYRVAKLVLTPKMRFNPGLFRFPLTLKNDFEITLLANLITLTPGTLTVDVADDRSHLLIHAVDCPDPDAVREEIANGFERLIREAFEE